MWPKNERMWFFRRLLKMHANFRLAIIKDWEGHLKYYSYFLNKEIKEFTNFDFHAKPKSSNFLILLFGLPRVAIGVNL